MCWAVAAIATAGGGGGAAVVPISAWRPSMHVCVGLKPLRGVGTGGPLAVVAMRSAMVAASWGLRSGLLDVSGARKSGPIPPVPRSVASLSAGDWFSVVFSSTSLVGLFPVSVASAAACWLVLLEIGAVAG